MASVRFNVGKGRVIEMYRTIKDAARPDSAFMIILLQAAQADTSLINYVDVGTLLSDIGNTECNFTNYARAQLKAADLAVLPAPDNVNDKYAVTFPDQFFLSAGGGTNNSVVKYLLCYTDDTTAVVDTDIVPLVAFDYATTTDGTNLLVEFPADAVYAT